MACSYVGYVCTHSDTLAFNGENVASSRERSVGALAFKTDQEQPPSLAVRLTD